METIHGFSEDNFPNIMCGHFWLNLLRQRYPKLIENGKKFYYLLLIETFVQKASMNFPCFNYKVNKFENCLMITSGIHISLEKYIS